MGMFLAALVQGQDVDIAARAAGIHRRTAYKWRRASQFFATAWDERRRAAAAAEDRSVPDNNIMALLNPTLNAALGKEPTPLDNVRPAGEPQHVSDAPDRRWPDPSELEEMGLARPRRPVVVMGRRRG